MKFKFENLDIQTRELMISEINLDIENERLNPSKRFNENGHKLYANLLLTAVKSGDEETLSISLKVNKCFVEMEPRNGKKGIIYVKVPESASQTFADSEFNRFYMRALALRAIDSGQILTVYRAKNSTNPRSTSEAMIGEQIDALKLLSDLRENIGTDTALGLPPGPNSGLTVRLT